MKDAAKKVFDDNCSDSIQESFNWTIIIIITILEDKHFLLNRVVENFKVVPSMIILVLLLAIQFLLK